MSRTRASWWEKADAVAEGWRRAWGGTVPLLSTVALLLAVAEHETNCGDAWAGEFNWGATTLRSLHPNEQAALAAVHVSPILSPTATRKATELAATEALRAAGLLDPHGAIHVDSRPAPKALSFGAPPAPRAFFYLPSLLEDADQGEGDEQPRPPPKLAAAQIVYFTYFRKGADDADGAAYFCGFFKTQSERLALAGSSPSVLARAMFSAHYYTGFSTDAETNIAAYAKAIAPLFAAATAALAGWSPGAEPPVVTEPATPDLGDPRELQAALNLAHAKPQLVVDGIIGPKTRAAIEDFQRAHDLDADGKAGPATLAALRAALAG